MAVPMKNGGMKVAKVIFYVLLSGVTTGIGAMRKHNRISYRDFSNWCLEGRCLKSPFWGLRDTPFKNRCLLTLGIIHNQGIFKI